MFLIEWYHDAEKEVKLDYGCKNLEEVVCVLQALTTHHEYLKDLDIVKTCYIYNVKIFNHLRETYDDWEDPNTGMNDPLELWEYLNG